MPGRQRSPARSDPHSSTDHEGIFPPGWLISPVPVATQMMGNSGSE